MTERPGKQYRPRSDAARGVWSGSKLFSTHPPCFDTSNYSNWDLFKFWEKFENEFRVNTVKFSKLKYQGICKVYKVIHHIQQVFFLFFFSPKSALHICSSWFCYISEKITLDVFEICQVVFFLSENNNNNNNNNNNFSKCHLLQLWLSHLELKEITPQDI